MIELLYDFRFPLLIAVVWCLGCNDSIHPHIEPDYEARTVSTRLLFVGEACKLGTVPKVKSGWVPLHVIFIGDEEILERTTDPSIQVKFFDSLGKVIAEDRPEFLFKEDGATFLFACFIDVSEQARGTIGTIEVEGNSQFLLLRKNFRVE